MKKRKLFTLVAAVSLLGSTGASILSVNEPATVQAAKKKKKSVKYPQVQIKYGARAYGLNKDGKIYTLKMKKKPVRLNSTKARAVMSYSYKGTTYYFVKFGKAQLFVRAKDTKRLNKKSIPSYTTILKNRTDELNSVSKSKPETFAVKTNKESVYWKSDGKLADDKLPAGTSLTVLCKEDITGNNGSTLELYYALKSDNTQILVQRADVTFDAAGAEAKVLTKDAFEAASKNYSQAVQDIINKYQAQIDSLK